MNVDEFIVNVNNLINGISQRLPSTMQVIGSDAIAVIKTRIQQRGESADGSRFPGYSTKEVPSFFFEGKGKRKLKKDSFGETILQQNDFLSYKQWREENGLQTDYVDMTFTGEMMRSLKIIEQGNTPDGYAVKIAGGTEEGDQKFDWNSKRYGDVLRVSKEEEEIFAQTLDSELQKEIDENGF
jgi:hypothetical protein